MAKTLLEIVQSVTGELLLNVPSAVLSSQDKNIQQIKYLVIAACDEMADMHDWQQLQKTYAFSTVVNQATYPLPADYSRFTSDTAWDGTQSWPAIGSVNTPDWQRLVNSVAQTGPSTRFRQTANKIELLPVPQSVHNMNIVYQCASYVVDANLGTLKTAFTQDGDKTVFHDRALINLAKLKWLQTKGFDTSSAVQDFNSSISLAKGSNVPTPSLQLAPARQDILVSVFNVPDGNFGM